MTLSKSGWFKFGLGWEHGDSGTEKSPSPCTTRKDEALGGDMKKNQYQYGKSCFILDIS